MSELKLPWVKVKVKIMWPIISTSKGLYKSGYSYCIIMLKVEFAEILSLNSAGWIY